MAGSMTSMAITLDGTVYHLRIAFGTLNEDFELVEGPNAGDLMTGLHHRDLLGTNESHSMQIEFNPEYPDDADNFFAAMRVPTDYHTITFPDGAKGTVTYKCQVDSGHRVYNGYRNGRHRWKNYSISFASIEPAWPAK